VDISSLGAFVSQEAQWGFMALWMGKKSRLKRVFPKRKVSNLIRESESFLLILG
jgi:hypothetical protein